MADRGKQGRSSGGRQKIVARLKAGLAHHQAGDLASAMACYLEALALDPEQPDALNLAGVAAFGLGERDLALTHLARAVALRPEHADAHCNYANVLQAADRLEEAREHLHHAISLRPEMALAHRNLGNLHRRLGAMEDAEAAYRLALETGGDNPEVLSYLADVLDERERHDEAIACYRSAMAADPNHSRAALNLSVLLQKLGRLDEALTVAANTAKASPGEARAHYIHGCMLQAGSRLGEAVQAYQTALAIAPAHEKALYNLGMVLQALGQPSDAAEAYRRLLDVAPDHLSAGHMLDAVTGKNTAIAPADHIREIFDAYSDDFERHLVQALAYDAPQALRRLVEAAVPGRSFDLALDLGCGTGLVAREFRLVTEAIEGVDLSPKMVAQAEGTGLYSRVVEGDVLSFLKAAKGSEASGGSYDLVLSADVFIYIGDLAPIFAALAQVMPPGGLFALSVEELPEGDFALLETGRYAQSERYILSLARRHGFSMLGREAFTLRKEWNQPIPGLALLLERTGV